MTNTITPFCVELMALTKTAAPEGDEVDPGWVAAQKGMSRASRSGKSIREQWHIDDDIIGSSARAGTTGGLKGLALGGAGGAGLGTLAALAARGSGVPVSAGALLGAGIGSAIGGSVGEFMGHSRAFDDKMRERGVYPRWGGVLGARFSPEAAEKYLPKQASAAKQLVSLAKKHKGKVGLVAGGAVAHDQGSQAYKDWKLGRQYRRSMERGRG